MTRNNRNEPPSPALNPGCECMATLLRLRRAGCNVGSTAMKNGFLRLISVAALCALATQASAAILIYDAALGNFESPPTGSPGTGFAQVTIDTAANTMDVMVTFSGFTFRTTASHLHCCTA